jgi:hypothetical protein
MKHFFIVSCFVVFGHFSVRSQSQILWNEAVDGLLSRSYDSPTVLRPLSNGTNSIFATVETQPVDGGWILYSDFFVFSVSSGTRIEGVYLTVNDQVLAWLGSDYGTQIGYQVTSTSGELLPYFGGQPLAPGSYAMYMSDEHIESFPTSVNYRLDFVVTPVPEPSTWALLVLGSACLASFARRRK